MFFTTKSDGGEEGENFIGGTMIKTTTSTNQEKTIEQLKDRISWLMNGEDDRVLNERDETI